MTGIPSGRSFARFDAFGMYTRLTARGFHDEMDWCTRTATSALASGVSATSPSIPAVFRPALLLRRLEDPLPQPPYLPLVRPPVDRVPFGRRVLPGGPVLRSVRLVQGRHRQRERVSCHRRLTFPSVPAVTCCSPSTAHLPTSARSRAQGTRPGIRPVMRDHPAEGRSCCPAFPLPFGCRHSLPGHPFPPGDSAPLTIGLPRRNSSADQDRFSVFRTRETRLDLGALCTPGAAVSTRPVIVPGRRLPHLSGQPLSSWTTTRPRT